MKSSLVLILNEYLKQEQTKFCMKRITSDLQNSVMIAIVIMREKTLQK